MIREGGFLQNRGKIALFLPFALEGTKMILETKGVEMSKSPSKALISCEISWLLSLKTKKL